MKRIIALLVLPAVFLTSPAFTQTSIPSPEDTFGFRMGTDRKLIDWTQIVEYFRAVDAASDRVLVQEIGTSTLGKPFLLAIISSAENMKRLDRYREIQHALARPYDLDSAAAAALVAEGKTVVLITLNIHSTEIASSQESVELLHDLATLSTPRITEILQNVIVLLIPSLNPDGQQMVVDWYRKTLGTPAEGTSPPALYHHYAGHDNNRDWFMFNLAESRNTARVLYHDWFPEINFDQHQMGSSGPRLFLPPYEDPVNPNVPAALTAQVNLLGKYVVSDMHGRGFRGIATGTTFNAFFEGTMSKTPLWHNRIGILSEAASVNIATPIFFPAGSVRGMGAELPENRIQTNYLDPWEGGWWRLRDIIEYEKAATYAVLEFGARFRTTVKTNYYELNRKAIADGSTAAPFGWLVPVDQHDPNAAVEMLNRLMIAGVRVEQLDEGVTVAGRAVPAGSYYIPSAQPARSFVKDLLERQKYPDLDQYPGGPPRRPYDITAWSLPLQMGVEAIELHERITVKAGPVDEAAIDVPAVPPRSRYLAFERRYNNAHALALELLKKKVPLFESAAPVRGGAAVYPAGTFLFEGGTVPPGDLTDLSRRWQVPLRDAGDPGRAALKPVAGARVGLYQPATSNMDEGWTRLVMDNYGVDYTVLGKDVIGKKDADLRKSFDVIIFPDMSSSFIVDGRWRDNGDREPLLGTPERPEEYEGGIGKPGVEAVKKFVHAGGTLLTFAGATGFAIDRIRVPASDELKGVSSSDFYAPGSILRVNVDTTNPLAYGMNAGAGAYFTNDQAFRLLPYNRESRIVAAYDADRPLASGWLLGEDRIAGKVAMAEIPVGEGRVILYGFRVQHRAQSHGTFKLFLNALLLRE